MFVDDVRILDEYEPYHFPNSFEMIINLVYFVFIVDVYGTFEVKTLIDRTFFDKIRMNQIFSSSTYVIFIHKHLRFKYTFV